MPDRGVSDPYGLAFGAPRPQSGYAPVVRPETRDTHPASWVGPLLKGLKSQLVFGTPNSLDPADPRSEKLVNLAALFVPGGKGSGGKFTGPLTPRQRSFLEQLQTHRQLQPSDFNDPELFPMSYDKTPGYAFKMPVDRRQSILRMEAENAPELQDMASALGHTYGNPLPEMLHGATPYSRSPDPKLGIDRGGTGQTPWARSQAFDSILARHVANLPPAQREAFKERLMSSNESVRRQAAQELYDGIANNTPIPTRVADLNTKRIADLIAKNLIQRRN